jgi:hypothetical protein
MAGRDTLPEAGKSSSAIKRVARAPALVSANVDDEIVLMSLNKGNYFGLDDIASDIWRRIEQDRALPDLVDSLAQDYDAPRDTIEKEVIVLLQRMAEQDLVVLS